MRKIVGLALGVALLSGASQAQQGASSMQPAPGDWPRYARDLQGTRFSPLDQINTGNVGQLQEAWRFRLRPDGGAGALLGGTVPIVVDGTMYLPLGNAVVALDPTSGKELWRHVDEDGEDPYLRVSRYLDCDAEGATMERAVHALVDERGAQERPRARRLAEGSARRQRHPQRHADDQRDQQPLIHAAVAEAGLHERCD